MTQTLVAANAALKDIYDEMTRNTLNNETVLLNNIESTSENIDFGGRRAVHNIHVSRNAGIGARGEDETLPTAKRQGFKNTYVVMRYLYGRIRITGPAIEAMDTSTHTFEVEADSEMTRVADDLGVDTNRQAWGTGDGIIALANAAMSGATLAVTGGANNEVLMRQLYNDGGMEVSILDTSAANAVLTTQRVTDYVASTGVITLETTNATVAATDKIVRGDKDTGVNNYGVSSGSGLPGDGQKELTGVRLITGTASSGSGVLHGLDGATERKWRSQYLSVGGALTPTHITTMLRNTRIESGKYPTHVFTDGETHADQAGELATERRTTEMIARGGYSGLRWFMSAPGGADEDVMLIWEKDCPEGFIFGLSLGDLVQYVMRDWGFENREGSVLRYDDAKDAYKATYMTYRDLAARRRDSHFVITGYTL